MYQSIIEKAVIILSKHTKTPISQIKSDSKLIDDLGLNSYDVISIITKFEDEFDIEIPDKDIKKLQTVGDIVDYIEGK